MLFVAVQQFVECQLVHSQADYFTIGSVHDAHFKAIKVAEQKTAKLKAVRKG